MDFNITKLFKRMKVIILEHLKDMKNSTFFAAGIALILSAGQTQAKNRVEYSPIKIIYKQDSANTISTAYAINIKEMEAAGLALNSGTNKTKTLAKKLADYFTKSNTELRALAKRKNVALPMSKPLGGMRPDGRIDSAPENMRDTSRNQSGTGEAGNNGTRSPKNLPATPAATSGLASLSGTKFDSAYLGNLKESLAQLNSIYQKEAQSGDPELKMFAKTQLEQLKKFSAN
ncbi:hypothetical protein ASG14_15320 [Pedobacter sp. Leaf194]|nr:hypothetical protein ASG14_15320 [Pedobacter sp. Leaf194]